MATELDDFGKGVFDEPAAEQSSVDESTQQEDSSVQLTDREIAIAKGEDPDNPVEDVQEDVEDQPEAEVASAENEQVDEPEESSAEESVDVFSLGDRKLAQKYGLTEEDLQKFGSPEALHHALDLFDRSGTKVQSQEDSTEGPAEESTEDAAAEEDGGALSELLGFKKLDVSKYENAEDPYDSDTLELVKHVRKTEDLLEKITESIATAQSSKNAETFHDMLDKYPSVYGNTMDNGKPVRINADFEKARQAVKDQAEVIYAGIVAKKGDVPPMETIIEQAMMAVHGKNLSSAGSKSTRSQDLKKQSSMKRSVGSVATTKRRQSEDVDPTDAKQIARHPDVEAFFKKAQEENGAV